MTEIVESAGPRVPATVPTAKTGIDKMVATPTGVPATTRAGTGVFMVSTPG
jgi:hypothetical protein